jgi:hypothetical protein
VKVSKMARVRNPESRLFKTNLHGAASCVSASGDYRGRDRG